MRKYTDQATTEIVGDYINDVCGNVDYLCDPKYTDMCIKESTLFSGNESVKDICSKIEKANKCETNIDTCAVTAKNYITESRNTVTTGFENIIVPIKSAFDSDGNQMFLRLTPLAASRIPGDKSNCNACACFQRFSKSTGRGDSVKYTAPGEDLCEFHQDFEYFYYPLDIEKMNRKLNLEVILGDYKVLPKNIIHSNEMDINKLHNLLTKNNVSPNVASNFVTETLYPNENDNFNPKDQNDFNLIPIIVLILMILVINFV